MSSSLGRAILLELLEVVSRNPIFYVKQFLYLPVNGNAGTGNSFPVDNNPSQLGDWISDSVEIFEDAIVNFGEMELNLINELKAHVQIVSKATVIDAAFQKYWKHGLFQQLNHNEFCMFLNEVGYKTSSRDALAIIRSLDNEDKDVISFDEIRQFLEENASRASYQLRDVQYRARCCLQSDPTKRYFPPSIGKVRIEICRTYLPLHQPRTLTPCQVTYMYEAALKAHEVTTMMSCGIALTLCHLKEGDMIVKMLKKDLGDTVLALEIVLPRMVNTDEAAKLVKIHAGNSYPRRQKLKALMGNAFNPLLGYFDGYYSLNLALACYR